ncbi:MAG TPA: imelysin family protein [Rhodothermales bacterium]|nr:imelysin family protein [Rhodothermales bacterium]
MKKPLFLLFVLGLFTACDDTTLNDNKDYTAVLENTVNNVFIRTYKDLDDKTANLVTALTTLENNRTASTLEAARGAWREARRPWEQSEGFLFGPVDQQGIDPSIDSWPVNEVDLNAVLTSPNTLTKSYIDGLEGTLKGFHTIEFLLFGTSGNKAISEFNNRQFEYLRACAESLKGATAQLYHAWQPTGENFGQTVREAGKNGNTVYLSQKSALQEFVDGLITITDEVGNGKINDPLTNADITLEESRFSANSKADFADNIRSVSHIYNGGLNNVASGISISDLVKARDAILDAKIKQQIADAIAAIEAIPGSFTVAIFQQKSAVQLAQTNVRDLQLTLEGGLKPLLDKF